MKRLNETHKKALRMLLDGELTLDEIAISVKKSRQTLYNWKKDPIFKAEYEEMERQRDSLNKARIARNAGFALERQKRIITESEDDRAAATVCADALDRAGYPRKKESEKQGGTNERYGVIIIPQKDPED